MFVKFLSTIILCLSINTFNLYSLQIWKTNKMKSSLPVRIYRFYVEGFRQMTLGKTLWAIILIKLFIMFFILRLFFFPNVLNQKGTEEGKQEYVATELIERGME